MWYFPALLDLKIREFVLENRNPYADAYFKTVNYGGDGLIVGTAWALFWGYGKISNDSGAIRWGRDGFLGFLMAGSSTYILKVLIGRERPYVSGNPTIFKPLNLDDKYQSLPSGHTAVAFSVVGVVWRKSKSPYLRIPSLIYGLSVAGARVYLDKHWLSDVIFGAGIGFLAGYLSSGI
jgi:membrane-associated phospholipid phosphatase